MYVVLIACNIMAGFAIALAFRARAIIVAAPIMVALNIAVLSASGYGIAPALLVTALCLFVGQLAFLLGSAMTTRACINSTEAPRRKTGKRFES